MHNLSKRTALYATAAYTKNKDTGNGFGVNATNGYSLAAGKSAVGYDFGIRHAF